jgi:wobble nucleotide-excising tRNase
MSVEIKNSGFLKDSVKHVVIRTLMSKLEEINQKLNDINENMKYFEKKYGMQTEIFYQKFVNGALEDDIDFFEWKASYEICNELEEEKKMLLKAIG